MVKLAAVAALAASLTASAQMDMKPSGHQSTDKEKIADALRAGPAFITKDAVIADWSPNPKDPNAEYRVLRAGKSDWTCLPGIPGYPHDEPMCLDKTSLQWIKDSLADRAVHTPNAGDGNYFDLTLRKLFKLIATGCGSKSKGLVVEHTLLVAIRK